MNTKRMTDFTHEYLPVVNDYWRVLSAKKIRLRVFMYHSSVITREYKSAQQELLASIFYLSVNACEQCIPHVAQA